MGDAFVMSATVTLDSEWLGVGKDLGVFGPEDWVFDAFQVLLHLFNMS